MKNSLQLPERLGAAVKRLRTAKGMAQNALAELAGVHRTSLNRLERGKLTNISIAQAVRLADALNLTFEELLHEAGGLTVPQVATGEGTSARPALKDIEGSALFQRLAERNPDLAARTRRMWENASKLYRHTAGTHPSHTSHGPDHVLAVLALADCLVAETTLVDVELYVLVNAILLHDIGMCSSVLLDPGRRDHVRQDHHIRTLSHIIENADQLSIDRPLAGVVAEVAAAHRGIDISRDVREPLLGPDASSKLRARLCAAVLRVADECHITSDRVPEDFAVLSLPDESLEHFVGHFNTTGVHFSKNDGTIIFTGRVESEDQDEFIERAVAKVQDCVVAMHPMLAEDGIPFRQVKAQFNRDAVLKVRVLRMLLVDRERTHAELVESLVRSGEARADTERFLRVYGSHPPFAVRQEGETDLYAIDRTQEVLGELVTKFIEEGRDDDALLLLRSRFAAEVLTDQLLTGLIGHRLGPGDPLPLLFRILRSSPSALALAFRPSARGSGPTAMGTKGLFHQLVGCVEADFDQFPELLLEPRLLDDVFADGERDREAWSSWKIKQIALYHSYFDPQKLAEQWVTKLPEDLPWAADATPTEKLSFTMTYKQANSGLDPMAMLIAASRMKLPLKLQETDDLQMSFSISKPKAAEGASQPDPQTAKMFEMKPGTGGGPVSGAFSARIERSRQALVIRCIAPCALDSDDIRYPLNVVLRETLDSSSNRRKDARSIRLVVNVRLDAMDCEQAVIIADAERRGEAEFRLVGPNGTTMGKGAMDFGVGSLVGPQGDAAFRRAVRKLATIQRLTGAQIPYPISGLPDQVTQFLQVSRVRTKEEARRAWLDLQVLMSKQERPYVSAIAAAILGENGVIERRFLGFAPGIHMPRVQAKFEGESAPRAEDMLKTALDDPGQTISLNSHVTLSSRAAFERVVQSKFAPRKPVDPCLLKDFETKLAEEARTRQTWDWKEVRDQLWYRCTPFFIYFRELTWERWLIEAQELASRGDVKRAYLAAQEARRLGKADAAGAIGLGWYAFLLGRTDEAIEVTTEAEPSDAFEKVLKSANLGLYNLAKARSDKSNLAQHQDEARQMYLAAIQTLSELEGLKLQEALQLAMADLRDHAARLPGIATEFGSLLARIAHEEVGVAAAAALLSAG